MSLVRQSQHGNTNKTKEVLAAAGRKNTSEHLTGHHMTAQDELSSGSRGEKRVKKAHIKLRRSQHCTWVRVGTCSNHDHMSIHNHHSCRSNHIHTDQLHTHEMSTDCSRSRPPDTPNDPGILDNCERWTCTKMCSDHTHPTDQLSPKSNNRQPELRMARVQVLGKVHQGKPSGRHMPCNCWRLPCTMMCCHHIHPFHPLQPKSNIPQPEDLGLVAVGLGVAAVMEVQPGLAMVQEANGCTWDQVAGGWDLCRKSNHTPQNLNIAHIHTCRRHIRVLHTGCKLSHQSLQGNTSGMCLCIACRMERSNSTDRTKRSIYPCFPADNLQPGHTHSLQCMGDLLCYCASQQCLHQRALPGNSLL